jgi:hypothetical protein
MTAPTINRPAMRHNVVLAYLRGVSRKSELAATLLAEHAAQGDLTPDRWAAAEQMFADARAPQEPTTTVPGPSAPAAPVLLDLSSLPAGMYAVPNGTTRLKVQIDRPDEGKWAGWIFVKDGAVYGEGRKYGHQRPGDRAGYRGEIEPELRAIVADPIEAMAEYGRITSTCGLCHRPLENDESVKRGIGPWCYRKMREALS